MKSESNLSQISLCALRDTKTCAAGSVKIKHGGYEHGLLSKGQDKS